jgi:hypothetical protein
MTALATHFTLGEMVATSHRTIDNNPPAEVIERLRVLCNDFLEPLRARFGSLNITSGFRCRNLNTVIGGASDSAHMYGCAADLVPLAPGASLDDMIAWVVRESGLPYDQVILEHSSTASWLHLGMLRPRHEAQPRRQALTFDRGVYSQWM